MKQILQSFKTGEMWLAEVPAPLCKGEGRGGRLGGFAGGSVCAGQIAGGEAVCLRVGELFDLRLFD